MSVSRNTALPLFAFVAVLSMAEPPARAAASLVTAPQGGVARWDGLQARTCGIYGKRYAAIAGSCYYPVDIRARPGRYEIALWDGEGRQHLGTLVVEDARFPEVEMELPAELNRYVEVSAEDRARASRESAAVRKVLAGSDSAPRFTLPLGKPAQSLPRSEDDFGSRRLFNGKHASVHSGRDYPVGDGNAVRAVADGRVVLAADHFFTGNAVYIDHGGGLVSMNFHLKSLDVAAGDEVKRGQPIGKIGATGRATGPHLHLGLRWLGKRIDPALLLEAPSTLPSVSDTHGEAEEKIRAAEGREPDESDAPLDDEG
ncbi:M23 family metallopeptidase [Tahibacter harae]|uniref:M23 family metallopeptidase n=1 Tax=Tahibacter harae TaxID=2963937 RepID=A0ABT1QTA2_9GAMM|nr:M23 family metallopeptidase [Tahibacter harae]MCQ4165523.1 M23 family metallopeptidase [Tahibacter harae]